MPSWIQDPKTGKLIPKGTYQREYQALIHVFKDFVSPIDGTRIKNSQQLRDHNERHGVTNYLDYGPDWFPVKQKEREDRLLGKADKQDRINAIIESMHKLEGK